MIQRLASSLREVQWRTFAVGVLVGLWIAAGVALLGASADRTSTVEAPPIPSPTCWITETAFSCVADD